LGLWDGYFAIALRVSGQRGVKECVEFTDASHAVVNCIVAGPITHPSKRCTFLDVINAFFLWRQLTIALRVSG